MTRPHILRAKDIEEIWIKRVNGVSDAAIGREYGISRQTVRNMLKTMKAHGLPVPKPNIIMYNRLVARIKKKYPDLVKKAEELA